MVSSIGNLPQTEESEVGDRIAFLGLLGPPPAIEGGMKLRATLPAEKAQRRPETIQRHLKEGLAPAPELEKLVGGIYFSQTCLFGESARTQLRCLYRALRAVTYAGNLPTFEKMTLRWRAGVIGNLTPRLPRAAARPTDFALYTDASTSTARIDALLFKENSRHPVVLKLAVSRAPSIWRKRLKRKNENFGLEMLDPLAFIWKNRKRLQN